VREKIKEWERQKRWRNQC